MQKRFFANTVFALVIFGAIFFNLKYIIRLNRFEDQIISQRDEISNLQYELDFYKDKELIQILNENKKLSDSLLINTKVASKEFINNLKSPKFVFYYSELHCRQCFEAEIVRLKNISKIIGSENIILFLNYKEEKYLRLFLKLNAVEFQYIRVEDRMFTDFIGSRNVPMYFIIDTDKRMKSFFIPDKANVNLTEEYLNSVKSFYQKSDLVNIKL